MFLPVPGSTICLSKLLEMRTAAANFCSIAASFGKEENKYISNYILTTPYKYKPPKYVI